MKITIYLFTLALFLGGCCSKSESTYSEIPADQSYFEPNQYVFVYEDSLGNHAWTRFGEICCIWSDYSEKYGEPCSFTRGEMCRQIGSVISGDTRLEYQYISRSGNPFEVRIENVILPSGFGSGQSESVGEYSVKGIIYYSVWKFTTTEGFDSNIKYVYYNLEDKIIEIRFSDGSVWGKIPS